MAKETTTLDPRIAARDKAARELVKTLLPRNRAWLETGAELNGESLGQMLERIIGMERGRDHTKHGTRGGATSLVEE